MAKALKCDRCGCLYESYIPEAPKKAKEGVNKLFDTSSSAYTATSVAILQGRYENYAAPHNSNPF